MNKLSIALVFCCLCLALFGMLNSSEQLPLLADSTKVEILRYFGYDSLLKNYFTLPFDLTFGFHQKGRFVDIGFLFLAFVPVVVGIYLWRHGQHVFFASFLFVCFVCLGLYVFDIDLSYANHRLDGAVYPLFLAIKTSLLIYVTALSGNGNRRVMAFFIFVLVMGFFLYMFSAGIVWYSFVWLILLLVGMDYYINEFSGFMIIRHLWNLSWLVLLALFFSTKLSHKVYTSTTDYKYSVAIPQSILDQHRNKKADLKKEIFEQVFSQINGNESKVYTIGTGLRYFIDNNQKRVFQDNQLDNFYMILEHYPSKKEVSSLLKVNGFQYIIVDLNTPSIDRTPNHILKRKFFALLQYLDNNTTLRLLLTDRKVTSQSGKIINDVFGSEIITHGSYAVYEIL